MSPYILLILLFTLITGTLITLTSSHWLIAWVGLELSTLCFVPIILTPPHPRTVEAATKYFIIQAGAAATLLFSASINAWLTGQWNISQMTHPIPTTLAILALSLKIGLAPTHFWLPEVLQGIRLIPGLILSTWLKLAPFGLLLQIPLPSPPLILVIGLSSTLLGGWGGLNQTQLRKILAYSSVAHLGWVILIIPFSRPLAIMTFTIYIIMTLSMFIIFYTNNATSISTLAIARAKSPGLAAITPLILLSLSGLPPLSGFVPKWLILQELVNQHLFLAAILAAFSALLSIFFYLRLAFILTFISSPHPLSANLPWRLQLSKPTFITAFASSIVIFVLPITPLLYAFFNPSRKLEAWGLRLILRPRAFKALSRGENPLALDFKTCKTLSHIFCMQNRHFN